MDSGEKEDIELIFFDIEIVYNFCLSASKYFL